MEGRMDECVRGSSLSELSRVVEEVLGGSVRESCVVERRSRVGAPAGEAPGRKKRKMSATAPVQFAVVEGLRCELPDLELEPVARAIAFCFSRLEYWLIDRLPVICLRGANHKEQTVFVWELYDILHIAMNLHHSLFHLANELERTNDAETRRQKRMNRSEFASRTDLNFSKLLVDTPADEYDKHAHRFCRVLSCLAHCLVALVVTYAVHYTDDDSTEIPLIGMKMLIDSWKVASTCAPQGLEKAAALRRRWAPRLSEDAEWIQPVSLNPLADFPWLAGGFSKPAAIESSQGGDSTEHRPQTRASNFPGAAAYRTHQATASTLIDLEFKPAVYLLGAKHFVDDVVISPRPAFHTGKALEMVKYSITALLEIRLPRLEDGWLIRCTDHGRWDLKYLCVLFLMQCFAHDRWTLEAQKKLDMPTQGLIWDRSTYVRQAVVKTLIILSYQLPYKDGAFKRFAPLVQSSWRAFHESGMSLLSRCRAINLTALSQAVRTIINASINDDFNVQRWLRTAITAAQTNAHLSTECRTAVLEFWARSFAKADNLESTPFLVYCAFALAVFELHYEDMLEVLPLPVFERYADFQKLFPNTFRHRITLIPASAAALRLRLACPSVPEPPIASASASPATSDVVEVDDDETDEEDEPKMKKTTKPVLLGTLVDERLLTTERPRSVAYATREVSPRLIQQFFTAVGNLPAEVVPVINGGETPAGFLDVTIPTEVEPEAEPTALVLCWPNERSTELALSQEPIISVPFVESAVAQTGPQEWTCSFNVTHTNYFNLVVSNAAPGSAVVDEKGYRLATVDGMDETRVHMCVHKLGWTRVIVKAC